MNASTPERPLFAFYGDDFTGSTDVLEALSLNGVPTVLFLSPPDPSTWRRQFPAARAIGVAGVARSLPTARMAAELEPALHALHALRAEFFLYKLCSTFDSSPARGSIGYALECVRRIFPAQLLPLVVGAPALRRYVVFGNLFAGFGPEVVRLDRHPTMSRHPVTPMGEADLRLHLAKQTTVPTALIDALTLADGPAAVQAKLDHIRKAGRETTVLFDTITNRELALIGNSLADLAGGNDEAATLPVAGSSAVAHALASHWQQVGTITAMKPPGLTRPTDPLVVVSGSASPQTAAQISAAEAQGWTLLRMDVPALRNATSAAAESARLLATAVAAMKTGRSVVIFSARGPDDPALASSGEGGEDLGAVQGRLLRDILVATRVRRACVAGGDTSGHAARQLGIYALEFIASVAPGSPLCRARSTNPDFDGIELALKGGQNGSPDYFLQLGAVSAASFTP